MTMLSHMIDYELEQLPDNHDFGDQANAVGVAFYKYHALFPAVDMEEYIRTVEFSFDHGLHLDYDHPKI